MILLSICIATRNRAKFIGETLESIVSQITDQVEIVVVDGASSDGTASVVQSFQGRHPSLRYYRLDSNGGVDADYCKSVELARGEYVWLFTDDDLLKPGAIEAVLVAACQDCYGLIVVNAEVRTPDLELCLQQRRMKLVMDKTYVEHDKNARLLTDAGDYLSFIGGVVMRRSLWDRRAKAMYLGSLFVHVGVIFQSTIPGQSLAIARPWIIVRYGNAQWRRNGFEIWMFKWPELIWSFDGLPAWAKRRVTKREPWRDWRRLLLERAARRYSMYEYKKWIDGQSFSRLDSAMCRIIARLPARPLNLAARVMLSMLGFGEGMTAWDLRQTR